MKKTPVATTPMARAADKSVSRPETALDTIAVPLEPTARMVEAGRLAGNGDPSLAKAIFSAMVDAAN